VPQAVRFESPKRSLEALLGIALTDLYLKDSSSPDQFGLVNLDAALGF